MPLPNDPYGVIPTIQAQAQAIGVDPALAIAIAQHESGLDPNAQGDWTIGGDPNGVIVPAHTPGALPTSFGLFQLHEGGELGQLTPQQAYNPALNASVALQNVATVARAYPNVSPGTVAALAQKPANQSAYAQAIDALYQQISGSIEPNYSAASAAANPFEGVSMALENPAALVEGIDNAAGNAANAITNGAISSIASMFNIFNNFGPFMIGVGLIIVGGIMISMMWGEDLARTVEKAMNSPAGKTVGAILE